MYQRSFGGGLATSAAHSQLDQDRLTDNRQQKRLPISGSASTGALPRAYADEDAHHSPADEFLEEVSPVGAGGRPQHPFAVPAMEHQSRRSKDYPSYLRHNSRHLKDDPRRSQSLSPKAKPAKPGKAGAAASGAGMSRSTSFSVSRNSTGSTLVFSGSGHSGVGSFLPDLVEEGDERPRIILAFDRLIDSSLASFLKLSRILATEVGRQADIVQSLFQTQRDFLFQSTSQRKPSAGGSGPLQAIKIKEVRDFAVRNRDSEYAPHLTFIAETVRVLGWVVIHNQPPNQFIRSTYETGKHLVRQVKKGGQTPQEKALNSEWVRSWQEVILDLEAYVRQYHPKGLKWVKDKH